jgi:hypothetical protein
MGRVKEQWMQEQEQKVIYEDNPFDDSDIISVNATTGEIVVSGNESDFKTIKQVKIKALSLLSQNDFVSINGVWEAKRDGLIKILSSLPISYSWKILDDIVDDDYCTIRGELSISTGDVLRSSEGIGICERYELKGNGGVHYMITRAETRAIKRCIDVLLGSVINYYVINYLEGDVAQRKVA